MSQSSPSGTGVADVKTLSANAASFYPSSSSTVHQHYYSQSSTGTAAPPSATAAAAAAPSAPGASASASPVASMGSGASPSPSASPQQSQSSSGASPPSKQQQQQQQQTAWDGLRVRTHSAGTMGTATSVGDTSAAIDHFSEYLYDYEDYEVSSQEVRVAMAQQSQEGMHQLLQGGHYDDQINSDIEAEMDRDQEMADMEGLVVAMNETSGVRVGGRGHGGGGGFGSSAHEYWFPECRDCGCCRGYKYGCVCVQGGVSPMCKCTSVVQSANGTAGAVGRDKRSSGTSSEAASSTTQPAALSQGDQRSDESTEMDLDSRAVIGAQKEV